MPRVWDYGQSAYENEKQNLIATRGSQNRLGSRFKKLFNRHKDVSDERPYYTFTEGMRALFDKEHVQDDIDKIETLIDSFTMFATSAAGTAYSLDDTLKSSFVLMQFDYAQNWYTDDDITLNGYTVAVSSTLTAAADDARRKSLFINSGVMGTDIDVVVDPLEDATTETFGAHLYTAAGTEYGHYADPFLPAGVKNQDINGLFCIDAEGENNPDDNPIFKDTLRDDFDANKTEFERYLKDYIQSTQYYNDTLYNEETHLDSVMLLSLGQLYDYIKDIRGDLIVYRDADPQSDRAKDDLELIRLLSLKESLLESITKPHKIKRIYLRFQKECTMPDSGKWQDAKELDRVKKIRDLEAHVILPDTLPSPGGKFWVYPKDSFLTLPNWKAALIVQTFLDIKATVKKKWYQKGIFKIIMAIVTIVLIVLTDNPVWVKILLITASVGTQFGLIGRDMQMLIAAAMIVYGVSSADFSSMSGADMFQFAVKNINMTAELVRMYEQTSVQAQYDKRRQEIEEYYASQKQDEAMRFVYSGGYEEFSSFYDVLYKY